MKKYNILFLITGVFAVFMVSCKKEYQYIINEQKDLGDKAFIKVYNSVVNSTRNYVYADNVPLNGAAIAYASNSLFPSVSPAYSSVIAGTRAITIKDTLVTSTQTPINFSDNFEAGQYYTIFTYDTVNNSKQKTIKDNIVIPADTTARLRFANFVFSKTAVPNVDIWSVKRKANIFTNIATTTVTDFIPYASASNDTLYVRATGTTANLATLNGINPTFKRSYTVIFRGRYQTTSGTVARTLTSFLTY
jgi:Domain of unknown function (DUF4397)